MTVFEDGRSWGAVCLTAGHMGVDGARRLTTTNGNILSFPSQTAVWLRFRALRFSLTLTNYATGAVWVVHPGNPDACIDVGQVEGDVDVRVSSWVSSDESSFRDANIECELIYYNVRAAAPDISKIGARAALSILILRIRQRAIFEFLRIPRWLSRPRRQYSFKDWILDNEPYEVEAGAASSISFSIIMPVFETPTAVLEQAIQSVVKQTYSKWELCIVDDGSAQPNVRNVLGKACSQDERIKVQYLGENAGISAASNMALSLSSGDWVVMLDHDDLLSPQALAIMARYIALHPGCTMLYSDEDKIDNKGRRFEPYFKPEFSWELLRSQNYISHLTVYRRDVVEKVGGWRKQFDGSQDYDLTLRVAESIPSCQIIHVPMILYHWRATEGSTALGVGQKSYSLDAGLRALQEHVERTGFRANASICEGVPYYRVQPHLPKMLPKVTIIIPTRNQAQMLSRCITSLVEKTSYTNYEILIVDNQTSDPEARELLRTMEVSGEVRVLKYDAPFNYSAINNYAVENSDGDVVVLLNNDTEVITADWLTEMIRWAWLEDVGCVGAKLYYPNNTIQHAGVILGIGGVAGHSHKYLPRHANGYFSRPNIVHNVSAVTGACLAIRRALYCEVGGLDAENLPVAFNDVDLCLKVLGTGRRNVFTPYAELYHYESLSRGNDLSVEKKRRFEREVLFMKQKWEAELFDRMYSPNLTLITEDFAIRKK